MRLWTPWRMAPGILRRDRGDIIGCKFLDRLVKQSAGQFCWSRGQPVAKQRTVAEANAFGVQIEPGIRRPLRRFVELSFQILI
jgi:hypothetical protein